MDDVCHGHFALGACPNRSDCNKAHSLSDLANPHAWVLFRQWTVSMAQFIPSMPYKVERLHLIPPLGCLVRCQTAEQAGLLVHHFKGFCNPIRLSDHLAAPGPLDFPASPSVPGPNADPFSLAALAAGLSSVDWLWRPLSPPPPDSIPLVPSAPQPLVPPPKHHHPFPDHSAPDPTRGIPPKGPALTDPSTTPPQPEVSLATGSPPTSLARWKPFGHTDRWNCSQQVFELVRTSPLLRSSFTSGWAALLQVWGIGPADLDVGILFDICAKTPIQQEQFLLTFAAIGPSNVTNPSVSLGVLLKDHDTAPQVCMYFLSDVCDTPDCPFVHPAHTPGWDLLKTKWNVTHRDLDFPVLNYLAKKPTDQQDAILTSFSALDLGEVVNLSAYLSSVIHKMEKNKPLKPVTPVPLPTPAVVEGLLAPFPSHPYHSAGEAYDFSTNAF